LLVQCCHVFETFFFPQIHNQKIHTLQENSPGVLCHTSHDLIPVISKPNATKSSVVGGKKKKTVVFPFVGRQHTILNVVLYFASFV